MCQNHFYPIYCSKKGEIMGIGTGNWNHICKTLKWCQISRFRPSSRSAKYALKCAPPPHKHLDPCSSNSKNVEFYSALSNIQASKAFSSIDHLNHQSLHCKWDIIHFSQCYPFLGTSPLQSTDHQSDRLDPHISCMKYLHKSYTYNTHIQQTTAFPCYYS